jgi:transposase
MLPIPKPRRKPAARHPFRAPLWDDQHPDYQRIDASLPCDHHARWLRAVVARLDLTAFRLSYAGYGSLAYPVELLLAFVLFFFSEGTLSPAQWARKALFDDQCKWLLRGLRPSRSFLYTFRDRVEPFLDDWHKQIIAWAVAEGITTAARGSLDGTFVAALASRHQLVSARRVDRRLVLLRLLVWFDMDVPAGTAAAQSVAVAVAAAARPEQGGCGRVADDAEPTGLTGVADLRSDDRVAATSAVLDARQRSRSSAGSQTL